MATNHSKQFISSYQGESDYRINGDRYSLRLFAHDDGQYNPGVYDREILPCVGTVTRCFKSDGFPSDEVMELFPGYIAARYNFDTKQIEYKGIKPETVQRDWAVFAKTWDQELKQMEDRS